MKYYKDIFESELQTDIRNNTIHIADQAYLPVEILELNNVYEKVFNSWKSYHINECRKTAKEILGYYHSNKDNFDELRSYHEANELIPFIGAGMSCDTGFLLWEQFLKEKLYNSSYLSDSDINFETIIKEGFENAAEKICQYITKAQYTHLIETHYGNMEKCKKIEGVINILPHIFKNPHYIITTNYDNILEILFKDNGFSPVNGISLSTALCRPNTIIKLHGSAKDVDSIILTSSEYDTLYNKPKHNVSLTNILNRHNLLFMGCSLQQDRTLLLLKNIQQKNKKYKKHYAFLDKSNISDCEIKKRTNELSLSSIFPIWYDTNIYDHNDSIESLLLELSDGEI